MRRATLLHFIALAFAWSAVLETLPAQAAQPPGGQIIRQKFRQSHKPNIILILADDLGYGDLGSFGQTRIKTPHLDRLAREGTRFTNFYAGCTVCAPSRASLMTGLHTGHTRIRGNKKVPLKPEDVTIAEVLKSGGYETAVIGKWGLGNEGTTGTPNNQGFIDWFGYLDQTLAHNYYPTSLWRNERLFPLPGNANGRRQDYSHDWFTRTALNYIRSHETQPFFLFLSYTIPHANNERERAEKMGMEVPSDEPYAKENWPQPEKNKAAMITRMDRDIGLILDRLKQMRLEEDTLILFSSDNGPHKEGGNDPAFFKSSGPLRGMKRDLYEGGIRVPLIAQWKGKVPQGRVSDQIWSFWDLMPTFADIAGVKPPDKIDGISMVPALLGKEQKAQHEFLYWEAHEKGFAQAVRHGKWKAVRLSPEEALELYDLEKDVSESLNVAKEHPEVIAKIENYLKTARIDSEDWPLVKKQPPASK